MIPRDRFFRFAALLFGLVLLAGCAYGPRVRTDADPEADFSRFRTWAFLTPLAMEQEKGYSSYTTDRVKASVRAQMQSRGYVYDERDPDLLVNFNGMVQERTDVYSMPSVDYAYYYSYRARGYYAVPFWYDRPYATRYTEGTLNIDLVDAARKRLAWEGVAVGRVARKRTPEERMAEIDQAVAEIFSEFPHRAGAAAPPI